MIASAPVVLRFAGYRVPRALGDLPVAEVTDPGIIDDVAVDARRLVVLGTDIHLGTVLTRLLKLDRLNVEVAYVTDRRSAATRAYGLPTGRRAARAALTGSARTMPLIRDEAGKALVGTALWIGPPTGPDPGAGSAPLHGEAIADDTVLFDGSVRAVRIEPTGDLPGLRATVLNGRMRPTGWVSGRAAQLGTTGAVVVRDGETAPRTVKRFAYYRHIAGWRAVR